MRHVVIVADLSARAITINGTRFDFACPPEHFYSVLGTPTRVLSAGPPAPHGHRNNQRHIYDALGIYLLEHHARRTIDGISFVFNQEEEAFAPETPFGGTLSIAGQLVNATFDIREFLRSVALPLKPHLRRWYYYDGEHISITVTTYSRGKTKSGRSSRVRGISSIEGDFRIKHGQRNSSNGFSASDADDESIIYKAAAELNVLRDKRL